MMGACKSVGGRADSRRIPTEIDKNFKTKPRIKRILVITKELKLIEFPTKDN